jgi:hypothetical protein
LDEAPNHSASKPGGGMNQQQLIIILAIVIVAVVAVAGFLLMRKRRSQALRERFGPEYDRVLKKEGDVRRGEDILAFRTNVVKNSK